MKKLLLLFYFVSFGLFAEGRPDGVSLGVATIFSQKPYIGAAKKWKAVPMVSTKFGRFQFGPELRYRLFDRRKNFLFLTAKPDFSGGYDDEDSSFLIGMGKRVGILYGGLAAGIGIRGLGIRATYLVDTLSRHGGEVTTVEIQTGFPVSILLEKVFNLTSLPFTRLSFSYGREYKGQQYLNYYFGARESEVNSERASYNTNEGT